MEQEHGGRFFEACPEALLAVRDGRITGVNEEARRLLSLRSCSEILGRRLEEVVPMDLDNRSGLHSSLGRILPGDIRTYEWELALPGAVYVPVTIRVAALGSGQLLLSLRDAGESRERLRILSDLEEQRKAFTEACPDPLACIDRDFRILWCNGSFAGMAGEDPVSLTGRTCHRIMGADGLCSGCPVPAALRSRTTVSSLVRAGERSWRATARAYMGSDGLPAGAVLVLGDYGREEDMPAFLAGPGPFASAPAALGGMVAEPGGALMTASRLRTATVDLAEWLDRSRDEFSMILGGEVSVLSTVRRAPSEMPVEHLMDALRRLAKADFGACLGPRSLIRLDRTRQPSPPAGLAPGSYLVLSLGSPSVLSGIRPEGLSDCFFSCVSSLPVHSGARGDFPAGAVVVSRDRMLRKFYQLLVPESGAGEDGS